MIKWKDLKLKPINLWSLPMATTNPVTGDSIATRFGDKSAKENYENNFDRIFGKKKKPLNEYPDNGTDPAEWDENRVDICGQNGSTGDHYDKV